MKLLPAVLCALPATTLAKGTFSKAWGKASDYAYEHPWRAGAMVLGAGAVAAPAAVAAPVLGMAGFAKTIVGGSAAAGVQSMIGNVAASSLFATLQSAGAGGYGVSIVTGAVQGAGLATVACAATCGEGKTGQDDKDEEAQDDKVSGNGSLKK